METERGKAREEMVTAVEQERERSKVSLPPPHTHPHTSHTLTGTHTQELLSEALSEERQRGEAAIQRAVEATREQVTTRMNEDIKVSQ